MVGTFFPLRNHDHDIISHSYSYRPWVADLLLSNSSSSRPVKMAAKTRNVDCSGCLIFIVRCSRRARFTSLTFLQLHYPSAFQLLTSASTRLLRYHHSAPLLICSNPFVKGTHEQEGRAEGKTFHRAFAVVYSLAHSPRVVRTWGCHEAGRQCQTCFAGDRNLEGNARE